MIEGVGDVAVEIGKHPNAIILQPIIDGRPQHEAYLKLAQEALKQIYSRSFVEKLYLVTGLPYESSRSDRIQMKQKLKETLHLTDISVYPQAVGTLIDMDFRSATIINIGHGTTEILVVEDLHTLSGLSDPLAVDLIISNISQKIQAEHGFNPSLESILGIILGREEKIWLRGRAIGKGELEETLTRSIAHLAEKISHNVQRIMAELPSTIEAANTVVLSGGGSLVGGMKEALSDVIKAPIIQHGDPIFSNARGYHKIGVEIYGED